MVILIKHVKPGHFHCMGEVEEGTILDTSIS